MADPWRPPVHSTQEQNNFVPATAFSKLISAGSATRLVFSVLDISDNFRGQGLDGPSACPQSDFSSSEPNGT